MIDFIPYKATLTAVEAGSADKRLFHFHLPVPFEIDPGQFIELSLPGIGAIPLSAASWPTGDRLSLAVRQVGRVTSALFNLVVGDSVAIRGPFGCGFPLERFCGHDVLLIAGGMGMVPLRTLLHWLLCHREKVREIILLYGSSHPCEFIFRPELEALAASGAIRVFFSVEKPDPAPRDQESPNRPGLVGDLLPELKYSPALTVAAVCGPPGLYGNLLEKLATAGVAADAIYATLERRMKCGVGECCHCVTAGVFVCCQGPVFSLKELRSMPGAV